MTGAPREDGPRDAAPRDAAPRDAAPRDDGAFAYEGLDRALHEKARLGILTALLSRTGGATFSELKSLCDLTDGNLNRHLKVLVDGGLVAMDKRSQGRRQVTSARLTARGRRDFLGYLDELERVIHDARHSIAARGVERPDASGGTDAAPA